MKINPDDQYAKDIIRDLGGRFSLGVDSFNYCYDPIYYPFLKAEALNEKSVTMTSSSRFTPAASKDR